MARYFNVVDEKSFLETLKMYEFLTPHLWFEHMIYHCIMDRGYRFLRNFVERNRKEYFDVLVELEDEGKTFSWSVKRLMNSSCSCNVCNM